MVHSECSMDIYKSVKINIITVMRNPEMLQFVHDHLKTKKVYKHAVTKLPFLIKIVLDQWKIQKNVW